jgi:flagellar basal body-associated protein FliL
MHVTLLFLIALLTLAVCALAFFWLFRSDKLRRAAYSERHAKFYRWDE